jgi:hypothetical protein
MPNTLGHIGIQGPLNSLFNKGAAPQWMLLGCVLPDVPWIMQRLLKIAPSIDPYVLRLYSLNQASLFFCLFLAAALALTTSRPRQIFLVLSLNSLLHLLLDATQIKWANGVHLLVPFSWDMLRLDWFWPEHFSCYISTLAGLIFLAFSWRKITKTDLHLTRPTPGRLIVIFCLLLWYGGGPFLFFQPAIQADNHFIRTLTNKDERTGKEIELDRARFSGGEKSIRAFTGETFTLRGPLPETSTTLSVQGIFIDPATIQASSYHQHSQLRDKATALGLLLVAALWLHSLIAGHLRRTPNPPIHPPQGVLP